jgi:hypothetical protein
MKPRLYMETTIPSLLTARPSKQPELLGHQITTQRWWQERLAHYEVYTSQVVLDEAGRGDPEMAAARLKVLEPFPLLPVTPIVLELEADFMALGVIPAQAADDALHLALAASHWMDFLLSWNCKHINNRDLDARYRNVCVRRNLPLPVIATPEELMYSLP